MQWETRRNTSLNLLRSGLVFRWQGLPTALDDLPGSTPPPGVPSLPHLSLERPFCVFLTSQQA